MDREEMIKFIVAAIEAIEGVTVSPEHFKGYTELQLVEQMDWYDYLLDK